MASFLYELQKYRFLLIVGGVVGALFLGKTYLWSSPVSLSAISAVEAGQDATVTVTADPNQSVNLTLTQPDDTQIELKAETQDSGQIKFTVPGEDLKSAGTYSLSAKGAHSKAGDSEVSFEVTAGLASVTHSRVSFSQNQLQSGQTARMVVLVADDYGNPVIGHSLTVTPSQNSVEVYSSEFATNDKGQMNFSVSGSGIGVVSFSIFDSTAGQNILGAPQLAFAGEDNSSVHLADTGPVASLSLSGLSDQTVVSEQQSVTVKALDASGEAVVDYTGTIRFSSTDSAAALPDDYTFTADDQGQHTFSLSVKLITPGSQTLTVTDTDQITVTGSESTTVVTTADATNTSSPSYNSNFETTDFTRTGDFTLVSPATGSYSSSSIDVQGQGEYGNTAVVMVNEQEAGHVDIAFDNSFDYTLENMKDGIYGIYVKIVDSSGTVLETSKAEKITVDTTPPTLASISADPSTNLAAGSTVTVTVLSEAKLESAGLILQGQVNTMTETSTPGKYQVELVLPNTAGDYSLDVDLTDALGNEAEYRNQLTLTVGAAAVTTPAATGVGQVTGLTATGGETKVALSWETPQSTATIAYYRVYYGPSADSLFAVSETYDASTTWTIPGLSANQQYSFAVTAVDVEGTEGAKSAVARAIPTPGTAVVTPPAETPPAIIASGKQIKQTPRTGPADDILLGLSLLGALAYLLLRKRARV